MTPLTVTFTNQSTPTETITAYLWNFGDGVTDTITNPVHVYTATGVFTVALTAFAGATQDTLTRTNYITVTDGSPITSVVTINYTYDPLYRLTGATYSGAYTYTFAYAYDKVGNRTVQTRTITSTLVTTYTYDAANRLATQNGQSIFAWDANGNLLQDGSTTYAYDFANRLISTTLGGATTQFAYNGDGIRMRLVEAGTLTTYTHDYASPLPVVLQAKMGSGSTQYVYNLGTRPLAEYEAAAWEYLLADPLGSVRQIADSGGNVTLLKAYEPYGSVLSSQGTATSIFGYGGEQIDSMGLIYLRARYMQPTLGVFLSRDPWEGDVLRPASMNGWSYVEGDPINQTDDTGLCSGGLCAPHTFAYVINANGFGGLALRVLPSRNASSIRRLPDGTAVWTTGNVRHWEDAIWQHVSVFKQGSSLIGWAAEWDLKDGTELLTEHRPDDGWGGDTGINFGFKFDGWPVAGFTLYQPFGPSIFAWCTAGPPVGQLADYPECAGYEGYGNPYTQLHGLHNGIDFIVGAGKPVVWTSGQVGTVASVNKEDELDPDNPYRDARPNVVVETGSYWVIFGHVEAECIDDTILSSGVTFAKTDDKNGHLHLGIVPKDNTGYYLNPASAFNPDADSLIPSMASYAPGYSRIKGFYAGPQQGADFWKGEFTPNY